jgi:hypothetical protein
MNRPFSAAVPVMRNITQTKKKNVMFNDLKEEQSEIDIPNDDDANDNVYNQFETNSRPSL